MLVPHPTTGLGARPGSYRQLVVDEVQEFGSPELAALVSSVDELSGLTIVGDVNQRMSSKSFPGWEKLRQHWDLSHSMSRFLSLTVSHRSTLEIMNLAQHVIEAPSELTAGRRGRPPIWFHARREDHGIPAAIKWLNTAIERYPNSVTAVICRNPAEAKHVLSLLRPTFGAAVRLGDEDAFSFEDGILVSDVASVKGLEFANVLIWNPSTGAYPQGEEDRNALYVAITRAEENLCIASWGRPTGFLPALNSAKAGKLVRVYDLSVEDEEE